MKIGETLKKLRENNNMTRKEAADKLKALGIDISDKTLYGYESGRNSANADMFLALCRIYKCQNIMEVFTDTVGDVLFTNSEWEIIEKYRDLDPHGKDMVNTVLEKEHKRWESEQKDSSIIRLHNQEHISVNAAHTRTDIHESDRTEEARCQEEDIMDDPDF